MTEKTSTPPELQRVGPYRLHERLHPRAEVYRAEHEVLGREAVVKLIRGGEPVDRRRFQREARAAARVDHPRVVRIFDFGEQGSLAYLAQELVPGEPLTARLARGPLDAPAWLRLARGLAEGLSAIHAAGLVHRDLKPENVMLEPEGAPKIIDFGLVRDLGSGSRVTGSNQLLGTPLYVAPEQARGDSHEATPAADVYALACLLHQAWTGRVPHETQDKSLRAFLQRRAAGQVELARNAPLPELLAQMLAPEPARRPAAPLLLRSFLAASEAELLGGDAAVATTAVNLQQLSAEADAQSEPAATTSREARSSGGGAATGRSSGATTTGARSRGAGAEVSPPGGASVSPPAPRRRRSSQARATLLLAGSLLAATLGFAGVRRLTRPAPSDPGPLLNALAPSPSAGAPDHASGDQPEGVAARGPDADARPEDGAQPAGPQPGATQASATQASATKASATKVASEQDPIGRALAELRARRWVQASATLTGVVGPEADAARLVLRWLSQLDQDEPLPRLPAAVERRVTVHAAPRVQALLDEHEPLLRVYTQARWLAEHGRWGMLPFAFLPTTRERVSEPLRCLAPERQSEPLFLARLAGVARDQRGAPASALKQLDELLASPLARTPLARALRPDLEQLRRALGGR
ncbi:MAG: protein kinase [Planctomycetota bacterium]